MTQKERRTWSIFPALAMALAAGMAQGAGIVCILVEKPFSKIGLGLLIYGILMSVVCSHLYGVARLVKTSSDDEKENNS